MASDGSVAPKERINIVYRPATGGAQEEIELPLKLVVLGDFTNGQENSAIEDRKPVNINKDNFNDVMRGYNINVNFAVTDKLSGGDAEIPVNLKLESLKDLTPDSIARQIPEINKLLELRDALMALKGPLGNVPNFRRTLEKLVADDGAREKLLSELNLGAEEAEEKSE